jgi:hypothetical protein
MERTKKQLEWLELFNQDYIEFVKNKQTQNQLLNEQHQNATGGLQK